MFEFILVVSICLGIVECGIIGIYLIKYKKPIPGIILILVGLVFFIDFNIVMPYKEIKPIDVYRGKTTLQITYRER